MDVLMDTADAFYILAAMTTTVLTLYCSYSQMLQMLLAYQVKYVLTEVVIMLG